MARYRGDESVFLMPKPDLRGASTVAEHLRAAIHGEQLLSQGSPHEQRLTVTIGVGALQPSIQSDPSALFCRADQAL
jgi:diguanylate cyclase (GGDEF)-like protein